MLKVFVLCFFLLICSLSAKKFNFGYDISHMEKFSKKDLKIATDIFLTDLLKDVNYEGNFFYYENMSQMSKDLEANKLDYISVNPISFLKYFDKEKVEASFTESAYNEENLEMVVLVRADDNITSWKDLKNKRFIFDLNDNISKMYVEYSYSKANGDAKIKYLNSKTNQKAILKLFFNKADVTVVRYKNYKLAAELNPQVAKRVVVFEKTGLKNVQIGLYRKNLDSQTKQIISDKVYNLRNSIKGQQVFDIYKIEKLAQTNFKDLEKIEDFYKRFITLKKKEHK